MMIGLINAIRFNESDDAEQPRSEVSLVQLTSRLLVLREVFFKILTHWRASQPTSIMKHITPSS